MAPNPRFTGGISRGGGSSGRSGGGSRGRGTFVLPGKGGSTGGSAPFPGTTFIISVVAFAVGLVGLLFWYKRRRNRKRMRANRPGSPMIMQPQQTANPKRPTFQPPPAKTFSTSVGAPTFPPQTGQPQGPIPPYQTHYAAPSQSAAPHMPGYPPASVPYDPSPMPPLGQHSMANVGPTPPYPSQQESTMSTAAPQFPGYPSAHVAPGSPSNDPTAPQSGDQMVQMPNPAQFQKY